MHFPCLTKKKKKGWSRVWAREGVQLEKCGITTLRLRRTQAGGYLLEIPGVEASPKADALMARLRETFAGDKGVVVSRPCGRLNLRITGFEGSITPEDLSAALASAGSCRAADIMVKAMGRTRGGLMSTSVRVPIGAALKLAKAGRVLLGWASARVVLLKSRPLRCFRCLAPGHVQQRCPASSDRGRCCFKCGQEGHTQDKCANQAHCPACEERGLKASHRPGGKGCTPYLPKPLARGGSPRRGASVSPGDTGIGLKRSPSEDF